MEQTVEILEQIQSSVKFYEKDKPEFVKALTEAIKAVEENKELKEKLEKMCVGTGNIMMKNEQLQQQIATLKLDAKRDTSYIKLLKTNAISGKDQRGIKEYTEYGN